MNRLSSLFASKIKKGGVSIGGPPFQAHFEMGGHSREVNFCFKAKIQLFEADYFKCLLMSFVISNMPTFAFPKTAFNFASVRMSRLFFGS